MTLSGLAQARVIARQLRLGANDWLGNGDAVGRWITMKARFVAW
jgi:hypothetical protein